MAKRLMTAGAFATATCLWWFAATLAVLIANEPGLFVPIPLVRWDHMEIVHDLAPWIALPFVTLGLWTIATRIRKPERLPPKWMTWACGAAALLWIAFAVWRGHEQVYNCLRWASVETTLTPDCSLPQLMLQRLGWFVAPIAAWLVLAALSKSSSPALARSNP